MVSKQRIDYENDEDDDNDDDDDDNNNNELDVIAAHVMETQRGMEVQLRSFCTTPLDVNEL